MPAAVMMAIGAIQAAIQAWPQVQSIVQKGKEWISSFREGNIITAEQQDALHARIDHISEMAQQGKIPEGWEVEP